MEKKNPSYFNDMLKECGLHFGSNEYHSLVPSVCGAPPNIQNTTFIKKNQATAIYTCLSGYTVKVPSAFRNGSLTVYTCVSGSVANKEVPYISCYGTHWTNTLLRKKFQV